DGVARRELIPELRPLTEHRADREAERLAVAPRHEPRDRRVAAAWRQDAGENLERRGLAGAVRPDERDALTRRDAERDPIDGTHRAGARRERVGDARAKPRSAATTSAERLAQLLDIDCCGHSRLRLRKRAVVRESPPLKQNAFPGDPGKARKTRS